MTEFVEIRVKSNSKKAIEEVLKILEQFKTVRKCDIKDNDNDNGYHVFRDVAVEVTDNVA